MTRRQHGRGRSFAVAAIVPLLLAIQPPAAAAQGEAPADLRAVLEGTWELVEWHVDGQVLRPPEIGGRWANNHGVVIANYHRNSQGVFESFAGYGTYEFDATDWSYTYERMQLANGSSVDDAIVAVRSGTPMRFTIVREGSKIILEGTNDRREYEDRFFLYMPNGRLLRKYSKVH